MNLESDQERVFITGIGCKLPKQVASPKDALRVFENGTIGISSLEEFQTERVWKESLEQGSIPPRAGIVPSIAQFDPSAFGILVSNN